MKALLALALLLGTSAAHATDLSKSSCRLIVTQGREKPKGAEMKYAKDENGETFQFRGEKGVMAIVANFADEETLEMGITTFTAKAASSVPLASAEHVLNLRDLVTDTSYVLSCRIKP